MPSMTFTKLISDQDTTAMRESARWSRAVNSAPWQGLAPGQAQVVGVGGHHYVSGAHEVQRRGLLEVRTLVEVIGEGHESRARLSGDSLLMDFNQAYFGELVDSRNPQPPRLESWRDRPPLL